MSGAVRLVVNADDFGFVASVNRGIVEAIEHGVVTSVSLMVNTPGTEDAIERLSRLPPGTVGVGLHFNIVAGAPLTATASLRDHRTGHFRSLPAHAWRAWRGSIDLAAVEAELEAQLARARDLLRGTGYDVTHVDSHRHAHCLPGIFDLVLASARRHGISHVRHPHDRGIPPGRLRAMLARQVLRLLVHDRPALDDVRFSGVALMASPTMADDMLALVAALPEGTTELMVHPGYDSPELAALDPYRAPRERELRALTSPRLRERIRERGVALVSFGATAPPA